MPANPLVAPVVSFVVANAAATAVGAQTHEWSFTALVGSVTVAISAVCGMIAFVAPLIAKVIREALPPIVLALAEVRNQREELAKGSYTGQIEDLRELMADLKADNAKLRERLEAAERIHDERAAQATEERAVAAERLEAANRKLHEIRNKLSADLLTRDVKIQELEAEIAGLRAEMKRLATAQQATATATVGLVQAIQGRTPDPDAEIRPTGGREHGLL